MGNIGKVTKNTLRARAEQVSELLGHVVQVVDRRDGYGIEQFVEGIGSTIAFGHTAREADAFLQGMQLVAMGNER